ncbi:MULTISPECIES: Lrp/AsnC family transcriptional regulator [Deferrisoma]
MQESAQVDLDHLDRAILRELQSDGRITNAQLARRVGFSESACLRRVRRLEEAGVIDRYVAILRPEAVGKAGTVFVRVSLHGQQRDALERFERAIREVPEVMECYLMSGDVDYLVRVAVGGLADYERVHDRLTRLPGVARVLSSFALRTVLKRTALPLG